MKEEKNLARVLILALVSLQHEVYVLSTASTDLRRLYRSHLRGEHVETTDLFHSARPSLLLLETVDIPKEKIRGRCVLWSRRFHECGYTVVNWNWVEPYVLHPHPDDAALYEVIRKRNLKKLCAPEKDLAANFAFKEAPHTIRLMVAPEELQALKAAAVDRGLSLEAYCKLRFDSGTVESIDLSELRGCEQRCRQVVMLLERERRLGRLQSEEIFWLQDAVAQLNCDVRALTAAIRTHMEVIKK